MANCESLIQIALLDDCAKRNKKGVAKRAWLLPWQYVNWEDCVFVHGVCTVLALYASAPEKCFFPVEIPGATPFTGIKKELEIGTYANTFKSTVPVVILRHDDNVAMGFVSPVATGSKYVLLVENNANTGEDKKSKFEFYGLQNGLEVVSAEHDPYSDDTLGGWSLSFEATGETSAAIFFSPIVSEASGVDVTREYIKGKEVATTV